MLSLGLEEARKLGIEKVVVSADETNPASWKTIENCGGVFYDTKEQDRKVLKIYTITL
jgi:predicted acetyltransferase